MKKMKTTIFNLMALAAMLLTWTACGDVEAEGIPQPRDPEVTVEAADYYVQITTENVDDYAFIYRWLDLDGVTWHISVATDDGANTIDVPDSSILTYNGVREMQITNRDILDYLATFGLPQSDAQVTLHITLSGTYADGTPIGEVEADASATSTIHITLGPGVA